MRKLRKGMSAIISSVLVMLLGIALAISLGYAVNSTSISLSPALTCTELSINPPIKIILADYNSESEQLEVQVERSFNSNEFSEMSILLTGEKTSEFKCGPSCGTCTIPNAGESKYYIFNVQDNTKIASIKIGDCIVDSFETH